MEAIGIAFRKTSFAQGAERYAHRGTELAPSRQALAIGSHVRVSGLQNKPQHNGVAARVIGQQGERWQVKLDTGEELALHSSNLQLPPRYVHKGPLAAQFNERQHIYGQLCTFSIRFVRCSVYEAVVDGRHTSILAEQELKDDYLKYNNNAGMVRTTKPRVSADDASEPLGVIFEEQEKELDDDVTMPEPIDAPHAVLLSLLVCGVRPRKADLRPAWHCIKLARDKQRRLEQQKRQKEQQALLQFEQRQQEAMAQQRREFEQQQQEAMARSNGGSSSSDNKRR
ncbi:hypothetical protein CYMTET_29860 [Cymbomonas tetramitiformis]|uniref:Alpha-type protein kinase domain-containing protein n=1 Tax=Cymbomonas tetramitiformis TaxID=36881 RepID=A0AAE0FJZ2_9CHLO|nr:hypothetical protein CYMTET_29860 [Cymbomonas tetramitiformis]